MRSIKSSEVVEGDVIIVAHRRRVVTGVSKSSSRVKLEIGEAGSIFLDPNEAVVRFDESEVVHCNSCERRNTHIRGVCVECGSEWFEPSSMASIDPQPSPPRSVRSGREMESPPPASGVGFSDVAGLVASLIGTLAVLGGLALAGLAIWLWHLTDTSRITGLDESLRVIEKSSGFTLMNEFHVIAVGLGISGVLFAGLGVGLLATFWSANQYD